LLPAPVREAQNIISLRWDPECLRYLWLPDRASAQNKCVDRSALTTTQRLRRNADPEHSFT
jgi:hypothetical protein